MHLAGSLLVLWTLSFAATLFVQATGDDAAAASATLRSPSGQEVAASESVPASSVSFTNTSEMNSTQLNSVVTAEFQLGDETNATSLDDGQYQRLRKAVIDELNKRKRIKRRKTTTPLPTTTPTQPTTTEVTVAETTEMELTTVEEKPTTTEPPPIITTTEEETTLAPTTTEQTTVQTTVTTTTTPAPAIPSVPWSRRRRRREVVEPPVDDDDYEYVDDGTEPYTEEDLKLILIDPVVKDGKVRVSFFVEKDGVVVDPELLLDVTKSLQASGELEKQTGLPVVDVYRGLPTDIKTGEVSNVQAGLDWRFFLAIVFLIALFIILICAFFCVRHRRSQPAVIDDSVSPMLCPETNSPAYSQPNGNGPRPFHDDDYDCYIVPYDEMKRALQEPKAVVIASEQTKL